MRLLAFRKRLYTYSLNERRQIYASKIKKPNYWVHCYNGHRCNYFNCAWTCLFG